MSSSTPPIIPKRTSSKRTSSKRQYDLTIETKALETDLSNARKKLKPSTSFDSNFWERAAECSAISYRIIDNRSRLELIKFQDGGGNPCDWWRSPEAGEVIEKLKAEAAKKKIFQKQAERIKQSSPFKRSIVHLFTTCQKGLKITDAGFGSRERSVQRRFKKGLLNEYALTLNDRAHYNLIWDVGSGTWRLKYLMRAAHLYPVGWGQDFMQAVFGEAAKDELFNPKNGLMLLKPVEEAFDAGAMVIVPDIPNDPTPQQAEAWNKSKPKEFKFRVLDHTAGCLRERISENIEDTRSVGDLDGKQLEFRSEFRPRTRYLYFMFSVAVLQLAWKHENQTSPEVLSKQLGKGFWGTRGRYVKKGILLAIVEEIGHDAQFLVDGAMDVIDEEDNMPDETGLLGIADHILRKKGEENEDDDEDDDNEEDDEDN